MSLQSVLHTTKRHICQIQAIAPILKSVTRERILRSWQKNRENETMGVAAFVAVNFAKFDIRRLDYEF
jgi:hypothetical protein